MVDTPFAIPPSTPCSPVGTLSSLVVALAARASSYPPRCRSASHPLVRAHSFGRRFLYFIEPEPVTNGGIAQRRSRVRVRVRAASHHRRSVRRIISKQGEAALRSRAAQLKFPRERAQQRAAYEYALVGAAEPCGRRAQIPPPQRKAARSSYLFGGVWDLTETTSTELPNGTLSLSLASLACSTARHGHRYPDIIVRIPHTSVI